MRPGELPQLLAHAGRTMQLAGCGLWGLSCSPQPRNLRESLSLRNGLVNGYVFGFRVRHDPSLRTVSGQMAEDVELSLRFFAADGAVLRYCMVTADTRVGATPGGIQALHGPEERAELARRHVARLAREFPRLLALQDRPFPTTPARFSRVGPEPLHVDDLPWDRAVTNVLSGRATRADAQ